MTPASRIVRVSAIVLFLFDVSAARVWTGDVSLGSSENDGESVQSNAFGFRHGGRIEFRATCTRFGNENANLRILMCPSDQATNIKSSGGSIFQSICVARGRDLSCKSYTVDVSSLNNRNETILRMDQRKFLADGFFDAFLMKCNNDDDSRRNSTRRKIITCSYRLALYNPDDEHLSSDEIPLPFVYLVITAVWSFGMALWLFNWYFFRKHSNSLHRTLTLVPLLAIATALVQFYHWKLISSQGVPSAWLNDLKNVFYSFQMGFLFLVLMMAGEGWCVCHFKVSIYKWIGMIVMFIAITASIMCIAWVHEYFLAFAVCCCVFVIYKSLRWSTKNVSNLVRQKRYAENWVKQLDLKFLSSLTIQDQISAKIHLYKSFRCVVVIWAGLSAFAICVVIFVTQLVWIRSLIMEVSQFVMSLSVVLFFRLQDFSPYKSIRIETPLNDYVALIGPLNSSTGLPAVYLAEEEDKNKVSTTTTTTRKCKETSV